MMRFAAAAKAIIQLVLNQPVNVSLWQALCVLLSVQLPKLIYKKSSTARHSVTGQGVEGKQKPKAAKVRTKDPWPKDHVSVVYSQLQPLTLLPQGHVEHSYECGLEVCLCSQGKRARTSSRGKGVEGC